MGKRGVICWKKLTSGKGFPNGLLFVAHSLKLQKGSIFGWREGFLANTPVGDPCLEREMWGSLETKTWIDVF